MDTRTEREKEAAELEAKAKAIRRQEKAFWNEVKERLDEVKERFDMSDRFEEICQTYDAYTDDDKEALYTHLVSERQVSYYRSTHKPVEDHQTDFQV